MLDDKLETLHRYINELDAEDEHKLLLETISTITVDESMFDRSAKSFKGELSILLQKAERDQVDEDVLIQELYDHLIQEVKRKLVFNYASHIGIERRLYKNEMGKLFKGKFK
jgi:hypothetical protein